MNQSERKFNQSTTFNKVIAALVVSVLVLNTTRATAQETLPPQTSPAPTAPDSPTGPTTPPPTATSPGASTDELQGRLNNLEQRLNKVSDTDLDSVSLILPSISSNVPNAYGASQGMVAVGIGFQNRLRYTNSRADGTASAVVGLSDPRKLGADIQVSFLDLSRFGHRTALGFKLHRQFSNDYAVAVGGENSLVSSYSDSSASYYAVVSKKLRLDPSSSEPFSRVYLSLGVGNGRFRSENDVFTKTGGINVFGSAAVNVNRSAMVFTEWTGQSLNVGTSIVPLRKYPFVVTLALADITGGGDGTRFTAGLGYVFAH